MECAPRGGVKATAAILTLVALPALAQSQAPAPNDPAPGDPAAFTLPAIEVISQQLEAERLQIQPSLGASTYYSGPEALQTIPQGDRGKDGAALPPRHRSAARDKRRWRGRMHYA